MSKLIGTGPNQVPTNADLGTMAYQKASDYVVSPLGSVNNPAESATALVQAGITANGYYYVDLGSGAQSLYCVLDGSIETGYGYIRVWDAGSSVDGTTIYHFNTSNSDYAAFVAAGGLSFVISELGLRTVGTWAYGPGYSATTITKYTGNGGSGLYANITPKTLTAVLAQSWTWTGIETDNFKNFGYANTLVQNQVYVLDDNDTPCGRQTSCAGTPLGIVSFGNANNSYWADGGNNVYSVANQPMIISGLYVR